MRKQDIKDVAWWWTLWMLVIVIITLAIVLACSGCRAAPPAAQRTEQETTLAPRVETEGDVALETVSAQDTRQQQGTLEERLVGEVESLRDLIQHVQSSVQTYGISPEQRLLSERYLAVGGRIALCVSCAIFGFGLILLAAPSPFKREWIIMLMIVGGVALVIAPPIVLFYIL